MLERCQGVHGDIEVIDSQPSLLTFHDALYVPFGDRHSAAGLFDCGRKIIPAGAYHRGPDPQLLCQYLTVYRYNDFVRLATTEDIYVYAGHLHQHFGHFLLSSFSRLWPFMRETDLSLAKIVVHVEGGVEEYFREHSSAAQLIDAIRLSPSSFVAFNELTKFDKIVVIAPSFEETSFAHFDFSQLCNYAGQNLTKNLPVTQDDRPVWLSKEQLKSGVRRVVNEDELTAILARRGVEIIYPEQLSLGEQARIWRDRKIVGAFVGSALHTSLLAPGKAIVGVSDSSIVISSFPMIDRVNGTKSTYLGSSEIDLITLENSEKEFDTLQKILRPEIYANSVISAFDALLS